MKINNKLLILVSASIAVLLIASGGWYFLARDDKNTNTNSNTSNSSNDSDQEATDQNPPTNEEESANQQEKDNLKDAEQRSEPHTTPGTVKTVKPIISWVNQTSSKIEVSSRVPDVLEDGGRCTLTLTLGTKTIMQTKTGVSNVSEVSCGVISIDKSKLGAGRWDITIAYKSNNAAGVSDSQKIEVK